jgi:hypothetical protein
MDTSMSVQDTKLVLNSILSICELFYKSDSKACHVTFNNLMKENILMFIEY